MKCYLTRAGKREEVKLKTNREDVTQTALAIERELPWLSRIDKDQFFDGRSEEALTSSELLQRYSDHVPETFRRRVLSEPAWMVDIRNRVGVHLIEAQRLLRFTPASRERERPYWGRRHLYVPTVNTYARDLQTRISETLTSYAKESQALDQSFPQRMLQSAVQTLSADDLKSRMQELEGKRQQLKRIGLIDEDPNHPFDITTLERVDETRRTVMTLYVEGTGQKLGVLEDLARRIEILLQNIEMLMSRTAFNGSLLVLEGDDDICFWKPRAVSLSECQFVLAGSKPTVVNAVIQLDSLSHTGVLGVVDDDYDSLLGWPVRSTNLVRTETRDMETLMLSTRAFERLLDELGDAKKIQALEQREGRSIRDAFVARALVFGQLRYLSAAQQWNVAFDRLKPPRFADLAS